jgi:hypothetical protein
MKVEISEIDLDQTFFSRENLNLECIDEYCDLIKEGAKFPQVLVYKNAEGHPKKYTLLDGFHTIHAALKAGENFVEIRITDKKSPLDCLVEAIRKNSTHGLQYTRLDKQTNIIRILNFPESRDWSNRLIADIIGVSDRTVANIRKYALSPKISEIDPGEIKEVKCFRNGKPYVMKLKNSAPDHKTENSSPATQSDEASHTKDSTESGLQDHTQQAKQQEEIQRALAILRELQFRCLQYSRIYQEINDGGEGFTPSILVRLDSCLADLRYRAEKAREVSSQINGRPE